MSIIFVLLSTLIIFSCSQLNGGNRWYAGYEHEGYSGKHYIGSKNGWRNIGKNYAYGNNGNNNGNGNIESNNGNINIGSNNGNIGNGGQWGLLESNRHLPCKNNNYCRVFVGMFYAKHSPTSGIDFQICNSQNRCVYGGSISTFGGPCRGMRDITNRNPSPSEHQMVDVEVTHIFRKEAIFEGEGDLTARISSITNPCVMIGLDPVMIYTYDGGVSGGTAYLPQGARREDYGTHLYQFDNVVET